jgi:group I intron endonuclease
MKQAGIYSFVNLVNGKRYIGQAIDIDYRIKRGHFQKLIRNNDPHPKLQRAWNKYGYQNFVVETLISTENEYPKEYLKSWLDFLEKDYIQFYDSYNNGYNCTYGGDGGKGCIHSKESNKLISERMKGENHPMYNKHHKEESKKLMGRSGEENWNFGKDHSGDKNGMYGKHHTEESKLKNKLSSLGKQCGEENGNSKPVILFSPLGEEFKLKSYQQFCKDNQLSVSHMCSVLKGHRPHHKGWTGKYLESKHIGGN